jgi:HK97 gp10 family phage protein
MARKIILGDKEIEALFEHLIVEGQDKAAKACLRAQMSAIRREIKKRCPVGPTGNLRQSIGTRLQVIRGRVVAKVGLSVGKITKSVWKSRVLKTGSAYGAAHAHLVALGTKARTRKKVGGKFAGYKLGPASLSTGVMPANPFVREATAAAEPKLRQIGEKAVKKVITKELAKLAEKGK